MGDTMQAMLARLREQFLDGLDERLDQMEAQILALAEGQDWDERFAELYRSTHSLKGSGGTHGLPLMTAICHALEGRLEELRPGPQPAPVTDRLLAYLDLLRECARCARHGEDEAPLQRRLGELEHSDQHALLVEPSQALAAITEHVLRDHGLRVSHCRDGLDALARLLHQPFQLLVCARHAGSLGGAGVIAALRSQDGPNRHIKAILISTEAQLDNPGPPPDRLIVRGADFLERISEAARTLLATG